MYSKGKMHGKRAFTLIELLVVIAIIGLLSSVVIASLQRARDNAVDAKKVQMVREYIKALELAYDANLEYPWDTSTLSRRVCLGVGNNDNMCFPDSGVMQNEGQPLSSNVNSILSAYISGPPANNDPINLEGLGDFRGIGYQCIESPNGNSGPECTAYAIFWVTRTPNTLCAGGFVDNSSNPLNITNTDPDQNVCIFTNNKNAYDTYLMGSGDYSL